MATVSELEAAASVVYGSMAATPQQRWPLLDQRCGAEVWVKHENHTPVGAFKVRGGLVYMDDLFRSQPGVPGIVAATRGNHGQSVAFAAGRYGRAVAVVAPFGNSIEKNRAMRALGAELIERGHDFQAALEAAAEIAADRGWHFMPSFHPLLVQGVSSYSLELFRAVPDLDTVYVPIGLGSGICGAIAARDALNLRTRIVGVVSAAAPAYARSLEAGRLISHDVTTRIADGIACRTPVARGAGDNPRGRRACGPRLGRRDRRRDAGDLRGHAQRRGRGGGVSAGGAAAGASSNGGSGGGDRTDGRERRRAAVRAHPAIRCYSRAMIVNPS